MEIDRIHFKCDRINASIVNGVRRPNLYSFGLDKPPGHKIDEEPRIELLERKLKVFFLISYSI